MAKTTSTAKTTTTDPTPTDPTTARTMTAVVQQAYGLDALKVGQRPVPAAGPGQLRIKVTASTVNPMDWHLGVGSPAIVRLAEGFGRPKHEIPGREACGVVEQLGVGVTDFKIGDLVFGWVTGAFAEYAIAEADRIWHAPVKMTEFECAALPVAGAAALEAIERGDVMGKRVVVNGASGGVGHYAVQLAKSSGAQWVAGVCSSSNADFVRGLGADQVVAYDTEDFTSDRWDVIIDCIGNRSASEIRGALVDDGRWVVIGDSKRDGLLGPLPRLVGRLIRWRFGSQSCHWFVQGEDAGYLEKLAALVENGLVRSHLSAAVTMDEVRAGYEKIESGRTVGKLSVAIVAERGVESTESSNDVGNES
ncbi:MAG: NAD(P)-dependent alcohol dehydrogenase [Acidimicrobiales bacterium]